MKFYITRNTLNHWSLGFTFFGSSKGKQTISDPAGRRGWAVVLGLVFINVALHTVKRTGSGSQAATGA